MGISSSDNSISIGGLATILTVAGVAIYVLGLVGLAVTIRLRFAKDISTAWYTVSLLPRTIVAGQGIRIWLGWPIVLTVVMSFGILLLESFGVDEGVSVIIVIISAILIGLGFGSVFFWRAWKASPLTGLPPVAGLIGVIVAMGGSGPVVAPIVITLFSSLVWGVFAASSSMLGSAVMLVAGLLIMRGLGSGYAEDYLFGIVDAVPPDKSALVGAIILFVGGFIIGVPAAVAMKPPLPQVQITKMPTVSAGEMPDSMVCNLVTHSTDGLWHVFDNHRQLWAIPDDKVLIARIPGVPPTTTPTAQGGPEEDNAE